MSASCARNIKLTHDQAQIPGAICALLLVISMPSLKISNANDLAAPRHPESLGGLRNYDWLGSLCLVSSIESPGPSHP